MVSEKVITKLGVEPPSHQMVDSYMAIIAENYNVPYERDPTAALVSTSCNSLPLAYFDVFVHCYKKYGGVLIWWIAVLVDFNFRIF